MKLDTAPFRLEAMPMTVGAWQGADLPIQNAERKVLARDATLWRRSYSKQGLQESIVVSIVITGQHPKASLHQPELCFRAQGWEPVVREIKDIYVQACRRSPFEVSRLVLESRGQRGMALYWFQSPDAIRPERIASFWSVAQKRFWTGKSERWAFVRVTAPCFDGVDEQMSDLLQGLWPVLLERWMG